MVKSSESKAIAKEYRSRKSRRPSNKKTSTSSGETVTTTKSNNYKSMGEKVSPSSVMEAGNVSGDAMEDQDRFTTPTTK